MARVEVAAARLEHIAPVAAGMRAADRDEAWAASLTIPDEALRRSLAVSRLAWAGLEDGRPFCLFGAAASPWPRIGVPWLLGTDGVERNATAFLRRNRPLIARMLAEFEILRNAVDARNTVSIRWLIRLGFTLHPARPLGPLGLSFHPFEMRRPMCTPDAGITAATTLASTAMSYMGASQANDIAQQQAAYQAQIDSNNQVIAQQNAQAAMSQANAQAQADREASAQKVAGLRAQLAANGIDLGSGSALAGQADLADQGELTAETALNAGQNQANQDLYQAGLDANQATVTTNKAGLANDKYLIGTAFQGVGTAQQLGNYF